jgi:hypothetical protein
MTTDDNDDRVGFKSPPRHHRFKPGQSGNPRGRPKGTRNLRTDLHDMLSGTIQVSVNGEPQELSRQQLMLLGLYERAAGKDLAATRMLLDLVLKLFTDNSSDSASEPGEPLSASDQEIVNDYLRRNGFTQSIETESHKPPQTSKEGDP